jgi:hypothetical protein
VSQRIPLQDAFERLLPYYATKPGVACRIIREALREGSLQLFCNGNHRSLDYVCNALSIAIAHVEGRWCIRVRPAGPGLGLRARK